MVEFEVGDTVSLNSGGPQMVIESINRNYQFPQIDCVWLAAGITQRDTFDERLLRFLLSVEGPVVSDDVLETAEEVPYPSTTPETGFE